MPNNGWSVRAVMLAGVMLGCAREPAPVAPVTEIQLSATAYDTAPRLPLVPLTALCEAGAADCDFGDDATAEPDVAGGTLLWEYAKAIRRHDRTGQRQADLGRKGKGPGEYEIAVAAGRAEGGLAVVDIASLRIARFDSAGGFLRFDPLRNLPQTTRALAFVAGNLVVFSIQPLSDGTGSAFRAVQMKQGESPDTLALHILPGYASQAGQFQQIPGLFSAIPSWKAMPDGAVLFTAGSTYDIWEYRDGQAKRRVQVDHAPRKVEQEELARVAERRRTRASPPMRAAIDDAIRRAADVHPAVTQLLGLPDGGLLAREAENVAGDSVRWTRFDRDWKVSGYFVTAEATRILLVQETRMLVQEQHDAQTALRWFALP